jgi:LPS-assembly lipoprotein
MAASTVPLTPDRRAWLGALAGLGAAWLLPGCGFALRQTPPLPFRRIALVGFDARSPLAQELRSRLAPQAQLVDTPGQADVVLQALLDRRERTVVASTAAGQVRELQLRVRLEFQLSTPGGRLLIPPTELRLSRDMSYSETVALGKAQEEAELVAAMQGDIVQQVLRRLAQVDPAAARP